MSTGTDIFIYDGDCGMCTATVEWLEKHGDGSVAFRPATPELLRQHGVSEQEAAAAAVLVGTDRRWEGSEAIGEVLRRAPYWSDRLLGRYLLEWPTRGLGQWAYGWVAKNRYRLSGSGKACGLPGA